jgi:hypothetical protein
MNIGSSPEYGEQPLPIYMAEGSSLDIPRLYRRLTYPNAAALGYVGVNAEDPKGGVGDETSRSCCGATLPQSK